ncbi:MAG: aliphatic sulfonate ABC transporter substrate-binding protein [Thermomicrobiales bacterium]
MRNRWLSLVTLGALLIPLVLGLTVASRPAAAQDKPDKIRLDYAYYNPSSLILKKFGWLEEDLKADGVDVAWTLSAGSNKANEFLRSEAIDFGSTAGAAALLAKANGSPIEAVYIFSKPEWTALVVPKDSTITSLDQLKGKKIAATKGTDPYFFLLRSLESVGLKQSDVEIVNLQHADGKTALERGDVDAWAGLDPFMAQTELEAGSKLLYRNIDFNSYGFLNARQDFVEKYPAYVTRVLAQYERARQWILDHPDEAAQILADEAKLSLGVAKKELVERTKLDISPVPGADQTKVLETVIPIFQSENQLTPGADAQKALDELYDPQYIEGVVAHETGS